MPGAIILAAGASERMGGTPKGLLDLGDGRTVLRRLLDSCCHADLSPRVVVLGSRAEMVAKEVPEGSAKIVIHTAWARGRTGSVKAGLEAAGAGHGGTLLWPVDHPFVRDSTLAELAGKASTGAKSHWWVPVYEGRRGHPILMDDNARQDVLGYTEEEPLNRYPREHPAFVSPVLVHDPGVVDNTDTPAAFAAALARWRLEPHA